MTRQPKRDDEFATWLKRQRDKYEHRRYRYGRDFYAFNALDDALDNYRLHADTGTPLDHEISEETMRHDPGKSHES